MKKKSEVGGPNAEVGKKSKVESPKSEEGSNSAPDSNRDDTPHSELNKSDPDSYRDENPKSEIKTMEVHHHPEVEKKGLKEYLLEGLMIFLAVTMGFFAESLRENIADGSKENEYILSMIQDAKIDTAKIQVAVKLNIKRIATLDSAASLCYNYDGSGNSDGEIHRLFSKSLYYPDYANLTERTLSQLKNAGGMRLIRKKKAVDSIILYDDFSKKLATQQEGYGTYLGAVVELSVKMLNYNYIFSYRQKAGASHKPVNNAPAKLINSDKAMMIELANRTKIFASVVAVYVGRLNEENKHAVNLIKTLKREYNLADE